MRLSHPEPVIQTHVFLASILTALNVDHKLHAVGTLAISNRLPKEFTTATIRLSHANDILNLKVLARVEGQWYRDEVPIVHPQLRVLDDDDRSKLKHVPYTTKNHYAIVRRTLLQADKVKVNLSEIHKFSEEAELSVWDMATATSCMLVQTHAPDRSILLSFSDAIEYGNLSVTVS